MSDNATDGGAGYAFDRSIAVERTGGGADSGTWAADVSAGWNVGAVPNGGYLSSLATGAFAGLVTHHDPLSVTCHFLRPAQPGPATLEGRVIKRGTTVSNVEGELRQSGKPVIRVLGAFTDFDPEGMSMPAPPPPALGEPDDLVTAAGHQGLPEIAKRFDWRFEHDAFAGLLGQAGAEPKLDAWMRFADGREPDALSLLTFADAMPPPVFNLIGPQWVPTIELTVHVRARPAPGWIRARFQTRYVVGGHLEEDGELWDSTGRLVAQSRQIAKLLTQPRPIH